MASKPRDKHIPAAEVERRLLRVMCSPRTSREQIIGAIKRLANYAWVVPEHAVVFQAIRHAVSLAHGSWRELLPMQATRMGFPDVTWSEYFATDADEPFSLNDLVRKLRP